MCNDKTASAGLFAQMVGRGLRKCDGKSDCLVLDYGGNIKRHGPIDALQVAAKNKQGGGNAPQKVCPSCYEYIHAASQTCPVCGFTFERESASEHETQASNAGILAGEITDTVHAVSNVYYSVHEKRGNSNAPKTLRIEYQTGFNQFFSEWVCPEHDGWARQKFEKWWTARSNDPPPATAADAAKLANAESLAEPTFITVREISGEKFAKIIKHELPDEKPQPVGDVPEESEYCTCGECIHYASERCTNQTQPSQRACQSFKANLEVVPF